MGKLTTRAIECAGAINKPYKLSDGEGLQLRVACDGKKTWLIRYVVGNATRQYTAPRPYRAQGGVGHMSLQEARDVARDIRALARQGIDYQQRLQNEIASKNEEATKRAQELADLNARVTVGDLLDRWQRIELYKRKDGGREVRRSFDKDVLPALGGAAVMDVTRAMIASVLDDVVERGSPIIARNLLSTMRQMFTFAIKRGLIERDPTHLLQRDDYGKRVERDRVLSESEIRLLVSSLATASLQESTVLAVWLMLSTCCRVGELSSARWKDVDLLSGTWRIPAAASKNGREHMVQLSEFSMRHFRSLHEISGDTDWCYPARHLPDTHICFKSISKQVHDRQRTIALKNRCRPTGVLLLPGGPWTPHDLRRTGATMMGSLGIRPDVIERCLNHVEPNKLVRTYQRQEMKPEQREAWQLLGKRLDILLDQQSNVVTLKAA